MSGQQRLRTAQRLYWSARKMKAAGLRAQHPDWPEARVEAGVRRIFLNGQRRGLQAEWKLVSG